MVSTVRVACFGLEHKRKLNSMVVFRWQVFAYREGSVGLYERGPQLTCMSSST